MSTERQREANRLNAQKSTGPTSSEGKAKSCLNHLSHGFTSNAVVMPGEDPAEFQAMLDGFTIEFEPQGQTEQILVEQMAMNQWLSLRAFRLQGFAFLNEKLQTGAPFSIPKDLALLIRYKTTADNAFHKAHNELVKTQEQRQKSEIGFESQRPSGQPKKEPTPITVTWVDNDPSPKPAAPETEFVPSAPEIFKTAV